MIWHQSTEGNSKHWSKWGKIAHRLHPFLIHQVTWRKRSSVSLHTDWNVHVTRHYHHLTVTVKHACLPNSNSANYQIYMHNKETVDIRFSLLLTTGESVWIYAMTSNPWYRLVSHWAYTLLALSAPYGPHNGKMTSTTIPEVGIILQHCQRSKNWVMFQSVVLEMLPDRQTDRQTCLSQYSTHQLGQSNDHI